MSTTVKYQIFVSSTYDDLKGERDQVVKAVLEMGHIPVGMEMFSAADEEQWHIIQRHIAASDYYVVIVAHRYGSMVEGVSYTEKEYDYAVEMGVPALGFVINDSASWPGDRRDSGADAELKRAKLAAFKVKVRRKPVDFWSNAAELHGKVAISLMKTMTTQPRVGWAPASQAAAAETAAELARLSKENAELRAALEQLRGSAGIDARFAEVAEALTQRQIAPIPSPRPLVGPPPADALHVFEAVAPNLAVSTTPQNMVEELIPRFIGGTDWKGDDYLAVEEVVITCLKEFAIQDLVTPVRLLASPTQLTEFGRAFLRFIRRGRHSR